MVIEDFRRASSAPATPTHLESGPKSLPMARVLDRVAAAAVDWLVVIVPALLLILAPFKKEVVYALVLEHKRTFAWTVTIAIASGIVAIWLYQIFSIYWWGATLGKRLFGLKVVSPWTGRSPGFGSAMLRATVYVLELGVGAWPYLAVFSESRRRPWHDRLADTIVIGERHAGLAPNPISRGMVRGFYASLLALALAWSAFLLQGVDQLLLVEDSAREPAAASADLSCEDVDSVVEPDGRLASPDTNRLEAAMALFAAGLTDRECVRKEADSVLTGSESGQEPLAYLAKAFVFADDPEKSNAYLREACRTRQDRETCTFSRIVSAWANSDWSEVGDLFESLTKPKRDYVRIWEVRYLLRENQAHAALEILNDLAMQPPLAPFVAAQRAKALWVLDKTPEARVAATLALPLLPDPSRMELAGWLCYEEVVRSCGEVAPVCAWVSERKSDLGNGDDTAYPMSFVLAEMALAEECRGSAGARVYSRLLEKTEDSDLKELLLSLQSWAEDRQDEARERLEKLGEGEDVSPQVRSEALRKLALWTEQPAGLLKKLTSAEAGSRLADAAVGRAALKELYRRLVTQGDLASALEAGQLWLTQQRDNLNLNRELVVMAYKLGRRKDALALLSSYENRLSRVAATRDPASEDEFAMISRNLRRQAESAP